MTDIHRFDEAMLSGYLDGELTQGDRQRVSLHLEDCSECRSVANDLRELRETTMNSDFQVPEDTQWDEAPRGSISRLLHGSSWVIAGLWVIGMVAYVVWQIATDSESIRFEGVVVVALLLAFGLIILSALIDRLKIQKNDPYRKVQK